MSLQQLLAFTHLMLKRLYADETLPLAGNITFRIVFSFFPFLIFLTAVAGFFGSAELAHNVIEFLVSVAPQGLVNPFAREITSILTVPRAGLLSIAAVLTVWSAMGGVDSVRVSLNRAYHIRETRPLWRLYLHNVLFVVVAVVGMLAVALLLLVLPVVMEALAAYAPHQLARFDLIHWWRLPLAVILLSIGLLGAHSLLPNRRLPFGSLWPGISFTLVAWIVLAVGFSWYLRHFNNFASTYASLSGIFATMFFIYLQALALILGGEINRIVIETRRGKTLTGKAE